jgi:NAD(P)-dependent dehydrogenase (short-subunit alcohol dehydrogenase family)
VVLAVVASTFFLFGGVNMTYYYGSEYPRESLIIKVGGKEVFLLSHKRASPELGPDSSGSYIITVTNFAHYMVRPPDTRSAVPAYDCRLGDGPTITELDGSPLKLGTARDPIRRLRWEYTDLFDNQPNYAWAKRGTAEVPRIASKATLARRVKEAAGLRGVPCRHDTDAQAFYPRGSATVLFYKYVEETL